MALQEMKAKWSDKIQIDTTHFVCTTPAATPSGAQAAGNSGAPGVEYQRALQLSIPVVQPHWILACHAERKWVGSHRLLSNRTNNNTGWFLLQLTTSAHPTHHKSRQASIDHNPCPKPHYTIHPPRLLPRPRHLPTARPCLHPPETQLALYLPLLDHLTQSASNLHRKQTKPTVRRIAINNNEKDKQLRLLLHRLPPMRTDVPAQ